MTISPIINIPEYNNAEDICVISCYFNPNNYRSKIENFKIFKKSLDKSNLEFLVIDASLNNSTFKLKRALKIIKNIKIS